MWELFSKLWLSEYSSRLSNWELHDLLSEKPKFEIKEKWSNLYDRFEVEDSTTEYRYNNRITEYDFEPADGIGTAFTIGHFPTPFEAYRFVGLIDELRIFNRALSTDEIAEVMFLAQWQWTVDSTVHSPLSTFHCPLSTFYCPLSTVNSLS